MPNHEKAVREAAQALGAAISAAEAAGYSVAWPHRPTGLAGIAISETAAVSSASRGLPAASQPAAPAGRANVPDGQSPLRPAAVRRRKKS